MIPLAAALPNATLRRSLRNTDHFATPESFGFIDASWSSSTRPAIDVSRMTDDIERARDTLRAGGLVADPDRDRVRARRRRRQRRRRRHGSSTSRAGRPSHPLIVHVASAELLPEWAAAVPDSAAVLAAACWPGPLTLLVHAARGYSTS